MWKMQLAVNLQPISSPDAVARGGPFTNAIRREKGCLRKWRRVERGGRMSLVVLRKDDGAFEVQRLLQLRFHPDLLFDPNRDRFKEGVNAARRIGQIRVQQAIELDEGLFVERNETKFIRRDAAFAQTIVDGVPGKALVMFLACESFFLRRRDNHPIAHQARRAVVVVGRDAKNGGGHEVRRAWKSGYPNCNVPSRPFCGL